MKGLNKVKREEIEQRARVVLNVAGYDDGISAYIDAVSLARLFGFVVEENGDMPDSEDGSVTVSEDGKEKNIVVNDMRSIEYKRFVITHELAHYLLHYMGTGKMFKHRENTKGKGLEENDADYFAACILMPQKSFVAKYEALKDDGYRDSELITKLQDIFKTPRESIVRRIDEVCQSTSN